MTRSFDRALLVAIVLVPAVLYVATAATHALGGDNGEMATLAVTGGVAHPSGYPLFAKYLHAMRWLPGTPAHAAALANGLLAIAAAFALARACRAWGASVAATAVVIAVWALAPTTWGLAVQAEVFALNALFAAVILWLAAPAPPFAPGPRAVALAFVAGLALSHHGTIGMLAPVGLVAFVSAAREAPSRARAIAASAAAFALGLAPYAWMFAAADQSLDPSTWSWGSVRTASDLYAYLGRAEYPASNLTGSINVGAELWRVTRALVGLPVVAAVAWLARGRVFRGRWIALVASFVLAGPFFALIFRGVPLDGIGGAVTERFDLLAYTLLAPACARGIDLAWPALAARPAIAAVASAAALVLGVARGLPSVRARERPAVELYAENALALAPPGSVILGTGDHRLGAFLYARYALGHRPDVFFVSPHLLLTPWYRARIERALGVTVPVRDRVLDVTALVDAILASGRPLFVTDMFTPQAIARFASYPVGPLIRIVPRIEDVPAPAALEALNLDAAALFVREPEPAPGPEPWSDALALDYARPWEVLAGAFRGMGDGERAEANLARARGARGGR